MFEDRTPIGECAHCHEEVYDERIYDGQLVCKHCEDFALSDRAIVEYIDAYPEQFKEYLTEAGLISEEPMVLQMLRDYRDWNRDHFDRWVLS